MKNYEEIKDEMIDCTMSCDLEEAINFYKSVIGGNELKIKCNHYSTNEELEELKLEIQVAKDMLDSFRK